MRHPRTPHAAPTSPEGSASRWRDLAANFGVAVLSLLVFLSVSEVGLRLYDRLLGGVPLALPDPESELYAAHPYLPIVLRPGTDYRDGDTAGHINALGLRGPERSVDKPPGVHRVLCVGGSTTFGAGIVGDENTWPARLEERLREARPDLQIEVWNAGVPGYTTAENVIYLSLRLLDFAPDLVVFFEGYNDFKPNRAPGFRGDYAHWRDRAAAPRPSPLEHWRLFTKLRSLVARLGWHRDAPARDPRSGEILVRHDTVGEEGLAAFRRNLRTMAAAAQAAGAATAFVTYPHPVNEANREARPDLFIYVPGYLPSLSFAGVEDAFRRYNDAIRQVAAATGSTLADAAVAVPPDPDLFVDHVHVNAAGADALAVVLAEALRPALPPPGTAAGGTGP